MILVQNKRGLTMKKIIILSLFIGCLFAKEYTLNFQGEGVKENQTIKIELKTDEDGKPLPNQRYDIRNLEQPRSLKIITASGLVGTLKDEREIVAYYKTNLDVGGLKIRNLYKPAVARVYGDENNITMSFDKDHYQNIISFLRYHNIKDDVIKDIDNMYGTWEEINK
jgi:peptidoglycan hydrolase-like protein with peptidoglycan-binding domain